MKVLANDGIAPSGKNALEAENFEVLTDKIEQESLIEFINEQEIEVLLVRSATKVRKNLIDACPNLKMIGRGGVGMDNIDVEYAREKGIEVFNTPAASSQSVAELVMAHLFGAVRFLYDSNRAMPTDGEKEFKILKKKYAKGVELRGKTIGVIGFGRIGQALATYALGCGMKVMVYDRNPGPFEINLKIGHQIVNVQIENHSKEELLKNADFISLHIPAAEEAIIGKAEFELMKDQSILINAARGGTVDEDALIEALDSGKLAHAALDVFENEPQPSKAILNHPKISLSPHIGAATEEAQDRIGTELAENIIDFYG